MGNRGPGSTIKNSPKRAKVDSAIKAGKSSEAIAKLYGFSSSAVDRYRAQPASSPLEIPEVPPPVDDSPQAAALWHCECIKARMLALEKANAPAKDIAASQGQYTNALRHHARLSGALDITEAQILKSTPWARIMAICVRALETDHPKACKALQKALADVLEGRA